jgi:hypothetical protein
MYTAAQKSIAQQDELRFDIPGMRLEREGFVQLQIAVISGVGTGKALALAPGDFVIGRDDAADLQIPDEFVSLRHCIVSVGPDRYEIKDCGSLNGTRLNGERIVGSQTLHHGCQILIELRTAVSQSPTTPFRNRPWNSIPRPWIHWRFRCPWTAILMQVHQAMLEFLREVRFLQRKPY